MNTGKFGGAPGGASAARSFKLPSWGSLDISVKIGTVAAATTLGAAIIISPSRRQEEEAALDMFDRPWGRLSPQEQRVAAFAAGRRRWVDFVEGSWYPLTRQLPGALNPVLNPYRDAEPMRGGGGDDSE
jgi:hypothetical protein